MEPQLIDFYNGTPSVNVIEKMNKEFNELQKKYTEMKSKYEPDLTLDLYIKKAIGSHYDMARLLYQMYKDQYKCISIQKNKWYSFNRKKQHWELTNIAIEFNLKLLNDILKIYEYRFSQTYHGYDKEYYNERYYIICNKLKKSSFRTKVIQECKYIFYNKDFLNDSICI